MGKRALSVLVGILYDILGCGVFAVAMHVFIAPNQIAPGGVSGLAVVLHYIVPDVRVGSWSLLLNIPILLTALRFLGWRFTLNTLKTVVILTVMIDYATAPLPVYTGDELLAALFAGALMGVGLGIVFMHGSTTGGSDVVSRLLQQKYPHLPLGKLLLVIDAGVILLSAVVFGRIETALYGMVMIFVSSKMIDSMLYGMETGKLVYIMSRAPSEISARVIQDLHRGCTILKSTGAFTQNDSRVLLVAVRRQQYYPLKKIVQEIDPAAFMIVTDSSEVLGEGFKPMA